MSLSQRFGSLKKGLDRKLASRKWVLVETCFSQKSRVENERVGENKDIVP